MWVGVIQIGKIQVWQFSPFYQKFLQFNSKLLVNRLRAVLKNLVSDFQNAFVPSRLISDNILIVHAIIEHIRRKKGKRPFLR